MLLGKIPEGIPLAINTNNTGLWVWSPYLECNHNYAPVIQVASNKSHSRLVGSHGHVRLEAVKDGNVHVASREERACFDYWMPEYQDFKIP